MISENIGDFRWDVSGKISELVVGRKGKNRGVAKFFAESKSQLKGFELCDFLKKNQFFWKNSLNFRLMFFLNFSVHIILVF